jgi:DNA-directed RNA polymerase specialized sigma24 family protein
VFARFARHDGGEGYLDALRECVDGLAGRARQAIELFYHDDLGRTDIAQRLEMTEDGVKSLLRRTRDVLRRCVEGRVAGKDE